MTHRCYYDRMDWWTYVASLPEPRVMVLQDVDPQPGVGAFVGEIHATIGRALKCVGCVTNGAVRDLSGSGGDGISIVRRQYFRVSLLRSHHRVRRAGGDRRPEDFVRAI